MLAQLRRRCFVAALTPAKTGRHAFNDERLAARRIRCRDEVTARPQVRIVEDIFGALNDSSWHTCSLQSPHDLKRRARDGPLRELTLHLRVRQFWRSQYLLQRVSLRVSVTRDHTPGVVARAGVTTTQRAIRPYGCLDAEARLQIVRP